MEFDIVELERKTMAEREAEENCWIAWMRHYKQGLRSSATILDGKVEPGGSLRIELRDESRYVEFLWAKTNCSMYCTSRSTASSQTIMTGRAVGWVDDVLVQTNSKWIWFASILWIVRLRRTGLSIEVAAGQTLSVGKVRLTDSCRGGRRTPQQSRPHPSYEVKALCCR